MDTFRYSAIDTAYRCLKRYQRQYLLQEKVAGLDSADTLFGTAMHMGLQAYLEGENGLQSFGLFWDSIKGTDIIYSRLDWARLKDCGETLLARFDRLHKARFEPFAMETTLKGIIGGYAVEGTPDFIGKYEGVPSVLDFKTSNYAYNKEKIITNEQMPIYAELARQALKYEAEQVVYYVFCKGEMRIQVQQHKITPEWLQTRLENVALMCAELRERKQFPMNPNNCMMGTFRCPYFDKCHGGKV